MFECRSCTWRVFKCLTRDTLPSIRTSRCFPHLQGRHRPYQSKRHASDFIPSRLPGQPYLNAAQIRHRDRKRLESSAEEDEQKSAALAQTRNLRKELIYLTDPLKLSEHIRGLVVKGQVDKAASLCRLASKSMNCVVGWNHIIDWHMKNGDTRGAFKLYNDMKKRAQFPDSYTYLLLLRGLAAPRDGSRRGRIMGRDNAKRAVTLYESMKSPTSKVKPSTIHTNAALRVCSQHMDMDALWSIISQIPENGPNSADRITFTTILQAIKHGAAEVNSRKASVDDVKTRKRQAAREGRDMWVKIVQKWKAGVIAMDEDLVHAMARVLMQSPDIADWDEVLSLVQQTTDIPRPVPAIGSAERQMGHVPEQTGPKESVVAEDIEAANESSRFAAKNVFQPLRSNAPSTSYRGRGIAALSYAKPGNAILSVILDACTMMRIPKVSIQYWETVTGVHEVRPDLTNLHAILRQLALSRASGRAVSILKDVLSMGGLRGNERTFILALTCCVRDKKNPNVIENSIKILDMMNEVRGQPSIDVLSTYLKLVLQPECADHATPAMSRLLRELGTLTHLANLDQGVSFLRSVAGAIHRLSIRGDIEEEEQARWEDYRVQINQVIDRQHATKKEKKTILNLSASSNQALSKAALVSPRQHRVD